MSMIPTLSDWAGNCFPGIDHAITVLNDIYTTVKNVKVYRQQCVALADRCRTFLWTLEESLRNNQMEGTDTQQVADVAAATMESVLRRVQTWASLNRIKSILQQGDIQEGIKESYQELDLCANEFNFSVNIIINRDQRDQRAILARDHAEIRELLQDILADQNELRTIIGLGEPAVQRVMQSIQEELLDSPVNPGNHGEDPLARGLWDLQKQTNIFPPSTDLTGQVTRTSEFPVVTGGYNDVYTGEWLGAEKVALKLPRGIITAPARRKFIKEVEIWRHLQHPNVARLYGIAYLDDQHAFTVTPWQENGTAIDYVRAHPEANKLRLLIEVASGLEYLHLNKIGHGDLRGANVLISDTGKALISDFGLSKVIEEAGDSTASTTTGFAPPRWTAPELLTPSSVGLKHTSVSPQTDVWSFGMLCLELMTGRPPFFYITQDMEVHMQIILNGARPRRPEVPIIADGLWNLMTVCWQREPRKRPSMPDVRTHMKRLETDPHSPFLGPIFDAPLSESPGHLPDSDLIPPSGSSPQPRRQMVESGLRNGGLRTSEDSIGLHSLDPSQSSTMSASGSHSPWRSSLQRTRQSSSSFSYPNGPLNSQGLPEYSSFWQHPAPESEVGKARRPSGLSLTRPSPSPSQPILSKARPNTAGSSASGHGSARWSTGHESSAPSPRPLPALPPGAIPSGSGRAMPSDSPGQGITPLPDPGTGGSLLSQSVGSSVLMAPSIHSPVSGHSSQSDQSFDLADRTSLPEDIRAAVMDPECDVRFSDGDNIAGGTAEGLIEQLLRQDQERYRQIFLRTYRLFLMPLELFELLIGRYNETQDPDGAIPYGPTRRYDVLLTLKEWLRSHDIDKEFALLDRMRRFAVSVDSPSHTTRLAREIIGIIDQRLGASGLSSQTSLSSVAVMCTPQHVTPARLAVALTILEGRNYRGITYADCILSFRVPPVRNAIDIVLETGTQLQNWVKRSVLHPDDVERRAVLYRFFIETAEACAKLHNYASMAAILHAIQSTIIDRLIVTRRIALRSGRTLKKLDDQIADRDDYKNYRKAIARCKNVCVPIISVHLADVRNRCTAQPVIAANGRYLINFERGEQLDQHIDKICQFSPPNVDKDHDAGVYAYLQQHLTSPKNNEREEDLKRRSDELVKVEEGLQATRYYERRAVGLD